MPGIVRLSGANSLAGYLNSADPIYGTGMDGDVTFNGSSTILGLTPSSSVYTMTRDIFANNLTLSANVHLRTNGYRVFVKNLLTMASGSRIGFTTGSTAIGSIAAGGAIGSAVSNSLGGSSATQAANQLLATAGGSAYYDIPHQAVRGWSNTATVPLPTYLTGGAGGLLQPGGGVVIVAARYIDPPTSGTAYISAPGTPPAGGGVVILVTSTGSVPNGISVDVTGQNAGTAKILQVN